MIPARRVGACPVDWMTSSCNQRITLRATRNGQQSGEVRTLQLLAEASMWQAGDITSRLSADTTTVSDQICLNINVIVRSTTQAAMVLVFMFKACWRLTVITFIMLPACVLICRVYGTYYRSGKRATQSRLVAGACSPCCLLALILPQLLPNL